MKRFFLTTLLLVLIIAIFSLHIFRAPKEEKSNNAVEVKAVEENVVRENSSFSAFGSVLVKPDFFLEGASTEIEAPEFFEADSPEDTLLYITGKTSNDIEVWKFPFKNTKETIFARESSPSGLVIDQENDRLFVTDVDKKIVESFSIPDLSLVTTLGDGEIESGENNIDILTLADQSKRLYVTDNNEVFRFRLDGGPSDVIFSPDVETIEEVLADSYHQIIYVPDEQGGDSEVHSGGAILAFNPDGAPFLKDGSNIFGQNTFSGDAEGMSMYRCLDTTGKDSGKGFIISTDQAVGKENGYEFFDRETWRHLGTLRLEGVEETDGIDVSERPLPGYPQGLLAAVNYDQSVSITSWEKISEATKLHCPE